MTDNMRNGIAMGICSCNENDRLRAYKLFFNLYDNENCSINDFHFKDDLLACISNESIFVKKNLLKLNQPDILITLRDDKDEEIQNLAYYGENIVNNFNELRNFYYECFKDPFEAIEKIDSVDDKYKGIFLKNIVDTIYNGEFKEYMGSDYGDYKYYNFEYVFNCSKEDIDKLFIREEFDLISNMLSEVKDWKDSCFVMFEPNERMDYFEEFNISIDEFVEGLDSLEL